MYGYYIKRILKSPVFWCCEVGMIVVMLLGCWEDLGQDSSKSIIYLWVITNAIGIIHVLIPVFTVLPFLYFYVDEIEKKIVYYEMIRIDRKKYYGGQILAAFSSAALLAVGATLIFTGLCVLQGSKWECNDSMYQYFVGTGLESLVVNGKIVCVYLLHCLAFCIYALPWTMIGMLVSLFRVNKYVILSSPFLCYLGMTYFTDILSLDLLNPNLTLLKGRILYSYTGGMIYCMIYHAIFIMSLISLFVLILKRRVKNEGI